MLFQRNLGAKYSPLFLFNAIVPGIMAMCFYLNIFWMTELSFSVLPNPKVVVDLLANTGFIESLLTAVSLVGFFYYSALFLLLCLWNHRNLMAWRTQATFADLLFEEEQSTAFLLYLTGATAIILGSAACSLILPFFDIIFDVFFVLLLALSASASFHGILLISRKGIEATNKDDAALLISSLSLLALSAITMGLSAITSTNFFFVIGTFLSCSLVFLAFVFAAFYLSRSLSSGSEPQSPHLLCFLTSHVATLSLIVLAFKGAMAAHLAQNYDGAEAFMSFMLPFSAALLVQTLSALSFHHKRLLIPAMQGQHYFVSMLSLIIPGICLLIAVNYFIHAILVDAHLLAAGSFTYWVLFLMMIALQSFLMLLNSKLNRRLFQQAAPGKRQASAK